MGGGDAKSKILIIEPKTHVNENKDTRENKDMD